MTPKVSLTTAVAIAALTVGTTAAPGQGRYGGSQEPTASSSREAPSAVAFEHGRGQPLSGVAQSVATISSGRGIDKADQPKVALESNIGTGAGSAGRYACVASDAFEHGRGQPLAGVAKSVMTSSSSGFERSVEEKMALDGSVSAALLARPEEGRANQGQEVVPAGPLEAPADFVIASPPDGIAWPQIGIGFGAGILLALGVVLSLRYARVRPLAQ
jgi:hypothetical protein